MFSNDFRIVALRPVAYAVQRGGAYKQTGVADNIAYRPGADQLPFSRQAQTNGALLLLLLEHSLAGLVMSVSIEASVARGAGVTVVEPVAGLRLHCCAVGSPARRESAASRPCAHNLRRSTRSPAQAIIASRRLAAKCPATIPSSWRGIWCERPATSCRDP